MDRTVVAACAAALAPLSLALGCGRQPASPPQDSAPLVLAELRAASPGPWRGNGRQPISITSLDHAVDPTLVPPQQLDARDLNDLGARWNPALIPVPAEQARPDLRFVHPGPGEQPLNSESTQPAPAVDQGAKNRLVPRRTLEQLPPTLVPSQYPAARTEPGTTGPQVSASPAPPVRTAEMTPLLNEAEAHVRQGFRLAERNALYLARTEWIAALELVAEAKDVQQHTAAHTESLNGGLAALEESRDFARKRPVGKTLDLARTVSGHQTPVLKNATIDRMSPLVAAERYYNYAQQQLAAAVVGEPCGSKALFGLAKATIAIGESDHTPALETRGQAMALYQASLGVDSRNHRAAHELGVLAANSGDWLRARDLLVHSLEHCPHPMAHRNLAAVYARLGETQMSEQATNQAVAMEQAGHRRGGPAVEWLDPATFAATAPASDAVLPPVAQPNAMPAADPAQSKPAVSTAKRGITDWLPWTRR